MINYRRFKPLKNYNGTKYLNNIIILYYIMKHKSDDYKISAVKYYLKNKDNIRKTCKIFDCSKSSLQRWIQTI